MLHVFMLSVAFDYHYAECHYAGCRDALMAFSPVENLCFYIVHFLWDPGVASFFSFFELGQTNFPGMVRPIE